MGVHYSYQCTKAENVRDLETLDGDRKVVLADLHFQDEHEHPFAPVRDTLVLLDDGKAKIVGLPEDVLDDDAPESDWKKWSDLCDRYPGPRFDVYDEDEFSALFAGR